VGKTFKSNDSFIGSIVSTRSCWAWIFNILILDITGYYDVEMQFILLSPIFFILIVQYVIYNSINPFYLFKKKLDVNIDENRNK
jgi:hypothetical protein